MPVNQFDHTYLQQRRDNDRDIVNSLVNSIDLCIHSTIMTQFSKSRKKLTRTISDVFVIEKIERGKSNASLQASFRQYREESFFLPVYCPGCGFRLLCVQCQITRTRHSKP